MREIRLLVPNGCIGVGYPLASFEEGLKRKPDLIGADAGSTDVGPYYLGAGISWTGRSVVKRDLTPVLLAGRRHGIPVVVGTAGGSGAEPHLQWCLKIVHEIAREHDLHMRMAIIHAEQSKEALKAELAAGKIRPLGPVPQLTSEDIDKCEHVVGQMGIQPFIKALDEGAEVIIAGRACDVAVLAALPIMRGFDEGLVMHAAKIVECGAFCSVPGSGADSIMAHIRDDHFLLEPLNPIRRCTPISVAAHTLYEQDHPYYLYEPTGLLDLSECSYEQYDERITKVMGSRFIPAKKQTIKLEGSKKVGHRTVFVGGVRDPIMIRQIDEVLEAVRRKVVDTLTDVPAEDYILRFNVYGRDGTMGEMEPHRERMGHELGLVIEVVAKTRELADDICALAKVSALHYHYQGRISTAGNLACLFSPVEAYWGQVYEFNVYHLLETDEPEKWFPIEYHQV